MDITTKKLATQEEVESAIRYIREEIDRVDREYSKNKAKLLDDWRFVKSVCPHGDVIYIPDASGNNDSTYFCNWCDCEVSRKFYKR